MDATATAIETPDTAAEVVTEPNVYMVSDSRMDVVKEKFAKLVKRAAKLGVEAPGFTVIDEHTEWEMVVRDRETSECFYNWIKSSPEARKAAGLTDKFTGAVRVMKHCILTGARLVKFSGWTFLATLDHDLGEDNTIIRAVPGTEGQLPADYRHRGNECDHCKRSIARKATYVCKHEDGRLVQIGSSCIKDFLGHDAEHAISLIEMFARAGGALEDEEGLTQRDPDRFELTEFLAWTAKAIREEGWVSRADARISGQGSTADATLSMMLEFRNQRGVR